MNQWFRQHPAARTVAAFVPLGLVTLLAYASFSGLRLANRWVGHTHETIETLDRILLNLADAETSERGYLLTHDARYLFRYNGAVDTAQSEIAQIEHFISDNPDQLDRLPHLKTLAADRLHLLAEAVALERIGSLSASTRNQHLFQGLQLMNSLREIVEEMQNTEQRLLARREDRARTQRWLLGGIFVVLILLLGLLLAQLLKEIGISHRNEEQLRRTHDELMQSQAALFQAQKLEAIGRLAGGVAHDFNNLLTGILGICDDLLIEASLEPRIREDIGEIANAGKRAAKLTKQMLGFSRRQIALPVTVNINTLILDLQKMLRRLIGEDIDLHTALDPVLGSVKIDPGQIEQILVNLILNARDALRNGGRITIETTNVEFDAEYVKQHFELKPGRYVMLAVSDNGIGMSAEIQSHVFEPFYTTKADHGTGLGLATVYGIVKQNSGDIFLYSTPGIGTTLKLYLPRTTDARPAGQAESMEHEVPRGTETVLLVEDEPLVRRVAKKALDLAGYTVLEAANAKDALEISATRADRIDLLLTDVVMPGMNGQQLAESLLHGRPQMKVLFMSGYTENVIVTRGILKPGIAFIEKSFRGEALAQKVREVLDGQGQPRRDGMAAS